MPLTGGEFDSIRVIMRRGRLFATRVRDFAAQVLYELLYLQPRRQTG